VCESISDYSIVHGPHYLTWRIIRFRSDLVADSTLAFVMNPSRYLNFMRMQRYKLVQPN